MNGFYFTFRGVTAAQRAQMTLTNAGVPSALQRAPGALALHGCGYCLRVTPRWALTAAQLLKNHGMQRCYRRLDGRYEEVPCDLL